jgi:hypothetical protein
MSTFASIHSRSIFVTGSQDKGWHAAKDSTSGAREVLFDFCINDDGAGQFLLVYRSLDGSLYADTWHETLDDAYTSAEREFGILKQEWSNS